MWDLGKKKYETYIIQTLARLETAVNWQKKTLQDTPADELVRFKA